MFKKELVYKFNQIKYNVDFQNKLQEFKTKFLNSGLIKLFYRINIDNLENLFSNLSFNHKFIYYLLFALYNFNLNLVSKVDILAEKFYSECKSAFYKFWSQTQENYLKYFINYYVENIKRIDINVNTHLNSLNLKNKYLKYKLKYSLLKKKIAN